MAFEQQVQARPRQWLTPITLLFLKEERSYGYELMERMDKAFDFEQINPGSVYRTLRQMEDEGLCQSEWETPSSRGGPPRRMYSITAAGEAYLDAWAESCKQYERLMDEFARIYTSRTQGSSE